MRRALKNPQGFTLLEVMIAIAIMAGLTIITAQAMRSGVENQKVISAEIRRDSGVADAMKIMRADVGQAFHYQDVFCKMETDLTAKPTPPPNQGPNSGIVLNQINLGGAQAEGTPKPCPPNLTGFIGTSEAMWFTSLSNTRVLRDSQESDQAKIGYYVKSCKPSNAKSGQSKCLYRSVSPYIDDELDKPGKETVLLENVEEFKLRYLGPKRDDYVDTWKTGKDGDDITKEHFPYAVEISLTVHDKSDPRERPVSQMVLAPIFFENNPKPKKDPAAEGNQMGGGNGGATGNVGGSSGSSGGGQQ